MDSLRALTPCPGFVDLQQLWAGCGDATILDASMALVQTTRGARTHGAQDAGPAAHVLEWGSVHALKISWAPQDLGLMEHVQQA